MTRLPAVQGDLNAWGTILNNYLSVAHNADGTLAVPITLTATSATTTPLTLTSAASQSADLLHVLASDGVTKLLSATSTGQLSWQSGSKIGDTGGYLTLINTAGATSASGIYIYANPGNMLLFSTGEVLIGGNPGAGNFNVTLEGGAAFGTAGSYGGGKGVIFIGNDNTDPTSNPSGGGILYVSSGALKYRGSSGTVTTIANA